jgi:hypothetical protein
MEMETKNSGNDKFSDCSYVPAIDPTTNTNK